ncbi:hypothetical protein [Botrimarina mediterranea]|uniref:Oligosaccharide repeat unit polymerase n=1 Tax=Botrimarina mediterranea TaxID=2528022 RepID=A0A518K3E5_9BACT|nr:hypothetical protein [Botrimarina mediterranea]QDV72323.1 hypothetical protein Spa11_04970 [Botrimarina mediterranea]QDV76867.1 hypothetical protein K2D_04500 [Planctomycetes bacterium K2D]
MNAQDKLLYVFSAAFAVVIALMIIVPIVRRKSDIFTAWNFFLVGAFVFNGMSGLSAATFQEYLPSLSRSTYLLYYLGVVLFYGTASLTYYAFKAPRRLAGNTLLNWPEISSVTAPLIAIGLMSLIVGIIVPIPIPFIGQLMMQFSLVAPAIAVAVLTVAWFRDRTNMLLLAMLIMAIPVAVGASVAVGGSRRYLMSMLAAVPVSMYWVWLRYKPTSQILTTVGVAIAVVVPVLAGYGAVRHADLSEKTNAVDRARLVLMALPNAIKKGGSSEGFMGQDSVECALSVIQLLNDGSRQMEVEPLASLWLMVTNPIPRSMWEEKPESVGLHLVNYFGLRGTTANLGLNVVGQCYYDGGIPVLILYAVMMGAFLRYYDELLVRRPGNPLLIGGLVAMSSQLIGWTRGCIGLMGMQIVQSVILVLLTAWIARMVFGTKLIYPRTGHIADYPILRSAKDWQRWMGSYSGVAPGAGRQTLQAD